MTLEARFHDNCFRGIIGKDKEGNLAVKATAPHFKWFKTSPMAGDPDCICSVCGEQIAEEDCPVRFWRVKEWRP